MRVGSMLDFCRGAPMRPDAATQTPLQTLSSADQRLSRYWVCTLSRITSSKRTMFQAANKPRVVGTAMGACRI